MYIEPFWLGVLATIAAEIAALVIYGAITTNNKKRGG